MVTTTINTPVIHIIEAGNYNTTLSELSLKYYGTPNLWPRIAEENGISGTQVLKPGDKIKIPGVPQFWKYQTGLIINNRNVFHSYSPFQGSDEDRSSPLVLIPPLPLGSLFTTEIPISISQLCMNKDIAEPTGFENDDFIFGWKPDLSKANKSSDLIAQITVKANNVWKTAPAERNKFRENFLQLRIYVEGLELKGVLIPGGLDIVTQRVAEAIPRSFEESLFFRYGFNSGFGSESNPYYDLLPGMRLQFGYSAEQSSKISKPVNGDNATHTIVRNQDGRIAFDAFLAAIATPASPFTQTTSNAGGLMDVQAAGNARRYYRLFYPTQTLDSVTLVGADTLSDLHTATQSFSTNGKMLVTNQGGPSVIAFSLPAKAVALPEIGVDIRMAAGSQITQPFQYVPLGKTVRQVVEDLIHAGNPKDLFTSGIRPARLRRMFTPASGPPEFRDVLFDLTPDLMMDYRIFDLPLVVADRVEINLPA